MKNKTKFKGLPHLIKMAVKEDFGNGDVTTSLFHENNEVISANIVSREEIIVCGTNLIAEILREYDPSLKVKIYAEDGERVDKGEKIATIEGRLNSILNSERVLLNFMQKLSGIATLTSKYVDAVKETSAKIYDTRKTTPGWRQLEKYAVKCGGGNNHRIGLYDAVLIKDNHLAQLRKNTYDQLNKIVTKAKKMKKIKFIEIEVDNLNQFKNILKIPGIDIILLDNMSPQQLKKAVLMRNENNKNKKPLLEASGGINLENVRSIAKTGVERISIGEITHSARSVDLGMDRNMIRTECGVIGGGFAGCTVALELADAGKKVDLFVKKSLFKDCNSYLAAGGLTAVPIINNKPLKGDSFEKHVKDTLMAGKYLNDKKIVEYCSKHFFPDVIEWLVQKGVDFDKSKKGYVYDLHIEGGHSRNRVFHAKDTTGITIMKILSEKVRTHPNITLHEDHIVIDLITSKKLRRKGKNICLGFYVYDIKKNYVKTVSCKATFVATGGLGKVFSYTSNKDIATGDGFAMCYRAGLPLANMEFIQFHPSVFYDLKARHENERRFLLTEALRGAGAIIKTYKDSKEDCILKYHPLGSKATRDVVSRAEDLEMKKNNLTHLWLDCTKIPESRLTKDFKNSYDFCLKKGFDMKKDPIPIVYAVHYSNGGVLVDSNSETSIKNCYVLGETSYTGLHGATRLASNSGPECILFGRLAAKHFLSKKHDNKDIEIPLWDVGKATKIKHQELIEEYWESIRRVMTDLCGISRDKKRLEIAIQKLNALQKGIDVFYWDYFLAKDFLEVRNIADVASIILESALKREESRACHFREDFPEEDKKFLGLTIVKKGSKPEIVKQRK
ncbi:MAG: carboxylating nicotinate-nucleotide diphosphorylase [Candidatus Nanoarchaeia archaeon]|nr:carboxylating nicotinate-nucleotide diphosphorylase [Candidatus Nanoarchaeia archaeon]MDD5740467.1 carboxylating nicotinate-nucleotide diphosphorylase [Candidatus Nanoarchaeia archaeon]